MKFIMILMVRLRNDRTTTDSGMIRKLNSIGKLTLKVPEAEVI